MLQAKGKATKKKKATVDSDDEDDAMSMSDDSSDSDFETVPKKVSSCPVRLCPSAFTVMWTAFCCSLQQQDAFCLARRRHLHTRLLQRRLQPASQLHLYLASGSSRHPLPLRSAPQPGMTATSCLLQTRNPSVHTLQTSVSQCRWLTLPRAANCVLGKPQTPSAQIHKFTHFSRDNKNWWYCYSAAVGPKKRGPGAKPRAAEKLARAAASSHAPQEQASQASAAGQEAASSAPSQELSLMERLAGACAWPCCLLQLREHICPWTARVCVHIRHLQSLLQDEEAGIKGSFRIDGAGRMDTLTVDSAPSKPAAQPAPATRKPRAAAKKRAPIIISDSEDEAESLPSSDESEEAASEASDPDSDAAPAKPQRPKAAAARKPAGAAAAAKPPPPVPAAAELEDSDEEPEEDDPESPAPKPKAAARKPASAAAPAAAKAAPAKRKPRVTKVLEDDEDEQPAMSPMVAPQVGTPTACIADP